MEKNAIFPKLNGFVHGGDYNPEQWLDRPDILKEDIRMMKLAGVNCVTLGVFSWSVYEPVEGEFHFEWLHDMMDCLYENGIYTILATPSGARPAWLDEAYPDAMRVSRADVRNHHGVRHNHCMSSENYRKKVQMIDEKLAKEFGKHPGLLMWHISNEMGGECFCPQCVKRFQEYLREKFDNDIEKLNQAWWTTFWSHRFTDFSQIEPPFSNGEGSIMGLNLEWHRFTTWNMNDFLKFEIDIVKKITPDIPVTTNFMMLYNGLDYRKMAESLDVISWDSYPRFHNNEETFFDTMAENAFHHTVMRSMKKDRPFMLMESAPGMVNWHPFNKVKRPGVHKLFSIQAAACGADTVQYFQWRKGRGSFEQYHGAVVDHLGKDDTRIFKETAEVGSSLKKISEAAGTLLSAKTALLFDWDNRWAIQDVKALSEQTKNYEKTCLSIWKEFLKLGVEMDIVASDSDLSDYEVVVAPMLYLLQDKTAENLKKFTERGGQLLATYFTGYVDKNTLCYLGGFPGDGLTELFGVISEEIDTLYPTDKNEIHFINGLLCQKKEEMNWHVRDYAEILRVLDAEVLGKYTDDFYAEGAAVTCKKFGKGKAYYVAARVDAGEMAPIFKKMLSDAGIAGKQLPKAVEYHVRKGDGVSFEFYLNHAETPTEVENVYGIHEETQEEINGSLPLAAFEAAVIRRVSNPL